MNEVAYFYFYDATGRIVQTGVCPKADLDKQKPPNGLFVAEGQAILGVHYRSDDGQLVPLPPRPSQYHYFDYINKEWVIDLDAASAGVRAERDRLLAESDWTQLPDVPLTTKEAWAAYRQALRDITEQPGFPFDVVWPEPPIK